MFLKCALWKWHVWSIQYLTNPGLLALGLCNALLQSGGSPVKAPQTKLCFCKICGHIMPMDYHQNGSPSNWTSNWLLLGFFVLWTLKSQFQSRKTRVLRSKPSTRIFQGFQPSSWPWDFTLFCCETSPIKSIADAYLGHARAPHVSSLGDFPAMKRIAI